MLIHSRLEHTSTNGPGERAIIHFQGCSLACPGCWNPDTHGFDLSKEIEVQDMVNWVLGIPDIEGLTLSGGEPMQQAPQLYLLLWKLKQAKPELTFGMYTGYSLKELEDGRWKWKSAWDGNWQKGTPQLWEEIRKLLDFAILGRYNQLVQSTDRPLCSSRNQDVVFFSDRYTEKDLQGQAYEVQIADDGLVQITGFPIGVDLEGGRTGPTPAAVSVTPSSPSPEKEGDGGDCACV